MGCLVGDPEPVGGDRNSDPAGDPAGGFVKLASDPARGPLGILFVVLSAILLVTL